MNSQELQRSRYLHFWRAITRDASSAEFVLCGGARVQGRVAATDSQHNRFVVQDLETPTGRYEKAVLRGADVEAIEIRHADWLIG